MPILRKSKKAERDEIHDRMEKLMREHGARVIEERIVCGKHDFPARYEIDTSSGPARVTADVEGDSSGVHMQFRGNRDQINREIPFPELNRHSGKCNFYTTGANHMEDALAELGRRLTIISTVQTQT